MEVIVGIKSILQIAFPAWAFMRLKILGMFFGVIFVWVSELLIHPAIASVEPGGLWPFFEMFWIAMGWPVSLGFVAVLSGVTWIVLAVIGKFRKEEVDMSAGWRNFYAIERVGVLLTIAFVLLLAAMAYYDM